MKKTRFVIIIALGLIIVLFAIDTPAKTSSSSGSIRSSSSSSGRSSYGPGRNYSGGAAKVSARGGYAGYRGGANGGYYGGGGNHYRGYSRGPYRGYYGWGSYWPYWSIGTYVTYIPDDYTTVYVDGTPYYYCDGSYFSPYSNGYIVVPTPEPATDQATVGSDQPIVAQSKSASHDTTTINVPNSKGGFTPVTLIKHKNGYIGPQGEFYNGHPTVAALKALYGD
jgi:hypothetical protein